MDTSEKLFGIFAFVFMGLFSLVCILPCLHVFSKSISGGTYVTSGQIYFWPKDIQLETITYILKETNFLVSLKNSLIVTGVGTAAALFVTITTAYPLSRSSFRGQKLIKILYVFSMIFFGGIVPAYMVVSTLKIIDTYFACILPFVIVQFNMFVVKNAFEALPDEIVEAAYLDGAGDWRTLWQVVVPMSIPTLATVTLLYAVTYWNDYFHAMMYTRSVDMKTMQVFLYDMIYSGNEIAYNLSGSGLDITNFSSGNLVAATVTLSIIPIVLVYPFVSRYLVNGITVGSVKG